MSSRLVWLIHVISPYLFFDNNSLLLKMRKMKENIKRRNRDFSEMRKDKYMLYQQKTTRRARRIALFVSIIMFMNYRYWMGKQQYPLTCNLVGVRCPSWPVTGNLKPGYESVVDAFKQNFIQGSEIGASFTAYVGKEKVQVIQLSS